MALTLPLGKIDCSASVFTCRDTVNPRRVNERIMSSLLKPLVLQIIGLRFFSGRARPVGARYKHLDVMDEFMNKQTYLRCFFGIPYGVIHNHRSGYVS